MPRVALFQVWEAAFQDEKQRQEIRAALNKHTADIQKVVTDVEIHRDPISTCCDLKDALVIFQVALDMSHIKVDQNWRTQLHNSDLWKACENECKENEVCRQEIQALLKAAHQAAYKHTNWRAYQKIAQDLRAITLPRDTMPKEL